MKRQALWWNEPLEHWSGALHFDYAVCASAAPQTHRIVGDWWREGDKWCLQLDVSHHAEFTDFTGSEDVRAALGWTLRALNHAPRKGWREAAVERIVQFSAATDEVLASSWHEPTEDVFDASSSRISPGYFAWIWFERAPTREGTLRSDELRASVEEVVQAYFPTGLLGWTWTGSEAASLLVYCSTPRSFDEWGLEAPATDADAFTSDIMREQGWLKACLTEMLDMLAADALILAKVAVGCRVSDFSQFQRALSTTVSAWRGRKLLPQSVRIAIWGEHPWIPLVQGIPAHSVAQFAEVAALRSAQGDSRLSEELLETLQGVVAANLNVSEAARLLYLHRNTLLHRIERIHQQTGYDIRTFQDAFVLWMVHVLLQSHP